MDTIASVKAKNKNKNNKLTLENSRSVLSIEVAQGMRILSHVTWSLCKLILTHLSNVEVLIKPRLLDS